MVGASLRDGNSALVLARVARVGMVAPYAETVRLVDV